MKAGFYPRLALDGIKKNKRLYLPYVLICIGVIMMYYIVMFLQYTDAINYMPGSGTISATLNLGGWVIAIFACIFLFYTNSFIIRRRKKEFGLYNMLGMGKRNIGRILFWETVTVYIITVGLGLAAGIILSKLAELGLVNIMQADITYDMSVSFEAIGMTALVFGVIFILLFLNSLRQVRFSTAISLMRSENTGEKPPKGNFLLGLLGLILLAGAYYIAVTTEDPVTALALFFVAVIMVIIGTYMLMISGSVTFCRLLQKNKKYYYKPNHFVSVSSMVYRMKRNGAGLASICVLATMVLVMLSSTASLYFGAEDALNARYPREIVLTLRTVDSSGLENENISALRSEINEVALQNNVQPSNINDYRLTSFGGILQGNSVETDPDITDQIGAQALFSAVQFYFIPLDDYNSMMGENKTLESGEALIYTNRIDYNYDSISFNHGNSFRIKEHIEDFSGNGEAAVNMISSIMLVVPDVSSSLAGLEQFLNQKGQELSRNWYYEFDTGAEGDGQIALRGALRERLNEIFETDDTFYSFTCSSREAETDSFFATFGSLFYLGIILSAVFISAAVLIIYYKQISEGYEDQARFNIMRKVGMTKKEIRKSINSQLLTVFFLPLLGAGLHLAFAFPIIRRLLLLFNLNNASLFALTTVISFVVFALFYTLVYRATSNAYYNIVSGAREEKG